jgi:hypothetical protein
MDFNSRLNNFAAVSVRAMRAFNRSERLEAIAPMVGRHPDGHGDHRWRGAHGDVPGWQVVLPATVGTSESLNPVNYYVQNGTTFRDGFVGGLPDVHGWRDPAQHDQRGRLAQRLQRRPADVDFNYSGKGFTQLLLLGFEHRNSPSYTIAWKSAANVGAPKASDWYPYGGEGPIVMTTNSTTPSSYRQGSVDAEPRLCLGDDQALWRPADPQLRRVPCVDDVRHLQRDQQGLLSRYNSNANLVQWGPGIQIDEEREPLHRFQSELRLERHGHREWRARFGVGAEVRQAG